MYPRSPDDQLADHWVVTHLPGKRALSFRPGGPGLTSAFLMWYVRPQSLPVEYN